jgi:hypothetical protein
MTGAQNDFFDNVSDKVKKGELAKEEMSSHLFALR